MRIEIEEGAVNVRGGTIKNGDRAGEAWEIKSQIGWLDTGGKHPEKITVVLPKGHTGYAPGFYTLAAESFGVGEYQAPILRKVLTLVPEAAALKSVRAG